MLKLNSGPFTSQQQRQKVLRACSPNLVVISPALLCCFTILLDAESCNGAAMVLGVTSSSVLSTTPSGAQGTQWCWGLSLGLQRAKAALQSFELSPQSQWYFIRWKHQNLPNQLHIFSWRDNTGLRSCILPIQLESPAPHMFPSNARGHSWLETLNTPSVTQNPHTKK